MGVFNTVLVVRLLIRNPTANKVNSYSVVYYVFISEQEERVHDCSVSM